MSKSRMFRRPQRFRRIVGKFLRIEGHPVSASQNRGQLLVNRSGYRNELFR